MKLAVCAIGKLKSGPEADLVGFYAKRIKAIGPSLGVSPFNIHETEAPKGMTGDQLRAAEGAALDKIAPSGAKRIILDERGDAITSRLLAEKLAMWRDQAKTAVAFFIGGADGHASDIKQSGDLSISFGAATWPHMLVRVMVAEQIYRSLTILAGHPYHRE